MISIIEWLRFRFDFKPEGGAPFGPFEAGVLVISALGLSVMQFGGAESFFYQLFGKHFWNHGQWILSDPRMHPYYPIFSLFHWVGFCVIGYFITPIIYIRLSKQRISDYYLKFSGFLEHIKVYVILYFIVIIPVILVSFSKDYQQIYPFYIHANRSIFDLIIWELAYGVQFFALEFLFRGFMLEGLRRNIGYGAVFVMLVPYCMLHFPKTLSESLGAIIAGISLGILAIRYRSIWGGVFLHWAIAISMDLLSLMQGSGLPKQWMP